MADEDLDALLDSALEDFKEEAEQVLFYPSFPQGLGLLPTDLDYVVVVRQRKDGATDPTRQVLQQTRDFPSILAVDSP
jgi:hypothetical protein